MQRSRRWGRRTVKFLSAGCVATAVGVAEASFPVAGLAPYARPAGAPVLTQDARSPEWMRHALFGVSEPFPTSLLFLMYQGHWYTPFTRPGMPGIYDIRGWHGPR
jgi:hypothetical protein